MFRNNKTVRIDPVEVNDLVLVRSEVFHFLEFIEYTKELFDSQRIRSKPSLIFYTENSTNKVILDYSLASNEDRMFLTSFFTKMQVGDAFTLSKGSYLDDSNEIEADVSSSLLFNKISQYMIFADVVSTVAKDANVNIYSSDFFINTPQISKSAAFQQSKETKIQALISLNPRSTAKPVVAMGYQPNDMLEIISPDSVNNSKKFRVIDAAIINDREVIYLETDNIVSESLLGKPVIINLYQYSNSVVTSLTDFSEDQSTLGCCINPTANVSLPYHTQKQCVLRGAGFSWVEGSCLDTTNINASITNSLSTTMPTDIAAQEIFDKNVLALKDSLNVVQYDVMSSLFKKKIINENGLQTGRAINEYFSVKNAPDQRNFFEAFVMDNLIKYSVPVVLNDESVETLTQATLPVSIFQQLNGISQEFVNVTSDTNVYKLLNISYEAIITDNAVKIRNFDGTLISKKAISLSKNIITTVYESNLTDNEAERILFTTNVKNKIPVVDFGVLGYGYLQLGRYHMFTPLTDNPTPLYIITNTNKSSDYSIQGVYLPALLPISSL